MKKTNEKTNVTITLDNDVLNRIRNDADERSQSVNLRINEILVKYEQFYKHADELKAVTIPAQIYKSMLDVMDEKIGTAWLKKAVNEIWPAILIHDNIPQNIVNFVDYSFGRIAKYAGLCSIFKKYYDEDGCLCLVFEHEFGIKWSNMIADVFSESLNNLFQVEVERKILPNTILIRILEKELEKINLRL